MREVVCYVTINHNYFRKGEGCWRSVKGQEGDAPHEELSTEQMDGGLLVWKVLKV